MLGKRVQFDDPVYSTGVLVFGYGAGDFLPPLGQES